MTRLVGDASSTEEPPTPTEDVVGRWSKELFRVSTLFGLSRRNASQVFSVTVSRYFSSKKQKKQKPTGFHFPRNSIFDSGYRMNSYAVP